VPIAAVPRRDAALVGEAAVYYEHSRQKLTRTSKISTAHKKPPRDNSEHSTQRPLPAHQEASGQTGAAA